MQQGQKLREALNSKTCGPHRVAVIRSAIHQEMAQIRPNRSLPRDASATKICNLLAPVGQHLTVTNADTLEQFAQFLERLGTGSPIPAPNGLLGAWISCDLGL
jgi:hypothetical protein